MAIKPDYSGCWAKLDHAKSCVDRLRSSIEAAAPNPDLVELGRYYDSEKREVIVYVKSVIQIDKEWPLLVGDAVHNLRSALDHLMWQLARLYLGRTPTGIQVKDIQFPEIRAARHFKGNRFLKYVRPDDLLTLKPFQPYKRLKKGQLHPLPKLVALSNIDKHRRLHLLVVAPVGGQYTNGPYVDCLPDRRSIDGGAATNWRHIGPRRPVRPNDVILRIFVVPVGPNPDQLVDPRLTSQISLGKIGPILPALDAMGAYVTQVISAFDPIG